MPTLLVVDDEVNVLYSMQRGLETKDLRVITASTAHEGVERVRRDRPDAVLLDVRLPDLSGLQAFQQMQAIDPRLPVVLITAYSTTETAIEAMRAGAFEYLLKPVDFRQLREVVQKAIEVSILSHAPATPEATDHAAQTSNQIVGHSAAMQAVYKAIGRIARQDVNVLVIGETGTGKELIARAIHDYSARCDRPFVAINCAAIPETLLESELFGYERGAFTGAETRRPGKFQQANGGTLFLDEIGDMTPATQAKILRVLQEQRFEPLGSTETIETDVRLIAATNQNLQTLISQGRFRQDLFYRLNVFTIHAPPLRDRLDDLPLLADHFVQCFQHTQNRRIRVITPEARAVLESYTWPGNVRELQSAIKYAIVHANGEVLTADCLPGFVRAGATAAEDPLLFAVASGRNATYAGQAATLDYTPLPPSETPARVFTELGPQLAHCVQLLLQQGDKQLYRQVHAEVDRVLLEEVLRHVHGNQQEAADWLGISRTTLRSRLRTLGMALEKRLEADSAQDDQDSSASGAEVDH